MINFNSQQFIDTIIEQQSSMNDNLMSEFNIKMQDIIENHVAFVKAKAKWINDLVKYIKKIWKTLMIKKLEK